MMHEQLALLPYRPEVSSEALPAQGVDEGDVLTADGWKPIQTVRAGDLVQSIDQQGRMSLRMVEQTSTGRAPWLVRTPLKRSVYMSMTPGQRVVYAPSPAGLYRTLPWDRVPRKSLQLARTASVYAVDGDVSAPFGWDVDDYLAFLGLFLAEGCTNKTVLRSTHKTVITQCTVANHPPIKALLGRLTLPRAGGIRLLPSGNFNVRYHEEGAAGMPRLPSGTYPGRARLCRTFPTLAEAQAFFASVRVPVRWNLSANGDFQISRKEVWEHFSQFGKAHEKFVPREILNNASPARLRLLLDWMMLGDGRTKRGPHGTSLAYFTTSHQLAGDVAEIGVKLGYKIQVTTTVLPSAAHHDRIIVYLNGENPTTLIDRDPAGKPQSRPMGTPLSGPRNDTELAPFNGAVYSLRVRGNGNFVLRQQGRVWIAGDDRLEAVSEAA